MKHFELRQTAFVAAATALISGLILQGCGGAPENTSGAASGTTGSNSDIPAKALEFPRSPAPAGARVFIIEPADGAVVNSPLTVIFGAENVSVTHAGVFKPATGHHHLIIDAPLPELTQPVPANDNYVHFGKGQTETTVELAPGTHTLRLLLADGNHIPHEPPLVSEIITITVE